MGGCRGGEGQVGKGQIGKGQVAKSESCVLLLANLPFTVCPLPFISKQRLVSRKHRKQAQDFHIQPY